AGQRARLALARSLLSDAPLVLLDEPTANVAAGSVPLLHRAVLELAAHRRVVAVTHDPDLAALADDHWHLEPTPLDDPAGTAPAPITPRGTPVDGAGRAARPLPVPDGGDDRPDAAPGRSDGIPLLGALRGRVGLAAACVL